MSQGGKPALMERARAHWTGMAGEAALPPALAWLGEEGGAVRPLMIGAHEALCDRLGRGRGDRQVGLFLGNVTRMIRYQKALREAGAARVDLEGEACGEVTEEQAAFARGRVNAHEKRKRKAAQAKHEAGPVEAQPAPVEAPATDEAGGDETHAEAAQAEAPAAPTALAQALAAATPLRRRGTLGLKRGTQAA